MNKLTIDELHAMFATPGRRHPGRRGGCYPRGRSGTTARCGNRRRKYEQRQRLIQERFGLAVAARVERDIMKETNGQ